MSLRNLDVCVTYNGTEDYVPKGKTDPVKLHIVTNSRGEVEKFTFKEDINIAPGTVCAATFLRGVSKKTNQPYCFIVSISPLKEG
jgi:hypothetical protein